MCLLKNTTKDFQAPEKASDPTENSSHMKQLSFPPFLKTILASLDPDRVPNPDPMTQLNPDPIRIRIRSTDKYSTVHCVSPGFKPRTKKS
jgi:hypothetical protein